MTTVQFLFWHHFVSGEVMNAPATVLIGAVSNPKISISVLGTRRRSVMIIALNIMPRMEFPLQDLLL